MRAMSGSFPDPKVAPPCPYRHARYKTFRMSDGGSDDEAVACRFGEARLSGPADPQAFARRWIAAWNARDLEAVLAMFADDAVFTSPLARRLQPDSGGIVHGKQALREYWQTALEQAPDLRF